MRVTHLLIGLTIGLGLLFSGCDSVGLDDRGDTCYSCGSNGGHGHGGSGGTGGSGGDTGGSGGDTGGSGEDTGSEATFISVNPRQTYLRTFKDNALDAPAVRLSDYDAEPGEQVCGVALGDFDTGGGVLARDGSRPLVTAVFSADHRLLAADQRNRVPGALNVDPDVATPATGVDDFPTDIAEDFDASDTCVTIPAGAQYVFLSAYDGYFADNSDVRPGGQEFGIQIK